jgi:hypothetical protein
MNAMDQLDSTATETLVRFLAARFNLGVPRIKITNHKANHGTYFNNLLRLSADAELWVVVHEFAHHLDEEINGGFYRARLYAQAATGKIQVRFRRPHTQAILHGEGFYFGLRRVIEAAGCQDYPWRAEYKNLSRWAERDGLIPKVETK